MCDFVGLALFSILIYGLYISCLIRSYKLLSFFMILSVFLAVFRGNSGIDTLLYLDRFNSIDVESITLVEPITQLLMLFAKLISNDFKIFTLIHSAIISIIYLFIFKKFNKLQIFFVSMFPVLYIDSIFNGLRIGLAYPFIILSVLKSSNFYYLIAVLSHVSSVLAIHKYQIKKISIIIIISIILFLFFYDYENYLYRYSSKYSQYLEISSKNPYSGIADFSALLLISFLFFLRNKKLLISYFFIFVPLLVIIFLIFHEYVFFIRLLRLVCVIMFSYAALINIKLKFLSYLFSVFGFLYATNFIRQISDSCYHPINGFLPLDIF